MTVLKLGPAELHHDGDEAVKITITLSGGTSTIETKRLKARCLPSLINVHGTRPFLGFDLVGLAGETLYRRRYTPPGWTELPGRRPRWVPLPSTHTQVLVLLVPHHPTAERVDFYAGANVWATRSLQGATS